MSVQIWANSKQITYETIRFSDGSSNIKIDMDQDWDNIDEVYVTLSPLTPMDNALWELLLIGSTFAEYFVKKERERYPNFVLNLEYLPHGRADRVFEEGNPLPLHVFLFILCGYFDNIIITDPHSDFYKDYERECDITIRPQHECVVKALFDFNGLKIKGEDVLISPDKGALDKVHNLKEHLMLHYGRIPYVVGAEKERDPSTGRVIKTSLWGDYDSVIEGKICWIIDDICDGGGTFIPLAKLLKEKGASQVNLYVTHGIFAKGLALFRPYIDNIYVYHTVSTYVNLTDISNYNLGLEVK